MHQLTPSEAALLSAETNTNLGHQSLCLELADAPDGSSLSIDALRSTIEANLHHAPSLRRRVRHVPFELDSPWWIEDPHFDLDYHVRHLAVPGAKDPDALDQLLARLHERPLDRSRPLWELYLIENPDGPSNVFVKVHTVVIEELGPLGPLWPVLAHPKRDLENLAPETWRPDMLPSDSDLVIKALWSIVRSPVRSTRHMIEATQRLPIVGGFARAVTGAISSTIHPIEAARNDRPVPRTWFNRPVGAHRRVARVTLPVEELKSVRRSTDVRFHDVLLAVISGSVRHWLIVNDSLPTAPIVALTPLLVAGEQEELGAALVPLATEMHDALGRLESINESMSELTLEIEPQSAEAITNRAGTPSTLAGKASVLLLTTGAGLRLMPPFNIYLVNIPGRSEGTIEGFEIAHEHVMCPLIDGIGLSISAISHDDQVDVTFVADRDLVPDLDVLAMRLGVELYLLRQQATAAAIA
jgi:WS/DGAT/MGAT family acyltransferase